MSWLHAVTESVFLMNLQLGQDRMETAPTAHWGLWGWGASKDTHGWPLPWPGIPAEPSERES